MSGSHTIGSLETWEPEDKSFSKHVLKEGTEESTPNDGSVCTVLITLVGDLELSESDLGPYKVNTAVEVTIGEGDTLLSETFDKVVMSMKEHEICYIKSKIDAQGNKVPEFELNKKALKFNCNLLSFNRAADSQDLEQDERLDHAQHHKEKGSELYQQERTEFAVKRFNKALRYLDDMEPRDELSEGLQSQHLRLACQCYLNLGACHLRKERYREVVTATTKALELDPGNVKGLFRRGQAYTKLHEYDKAKADLVRARHVEPENKAVMNQFVTVETLIKKEKQVYRNMFSK